MTFSIKSLATRTDKILDQQQQKKIETSLLQKFISKNNIKVKNISLIKLYIINIQ